MPYVHVLYTREIYSYTFQTSVLNSRWSVIDLWLSGLLIKLNLLQEEETGGGPMELKAGFKFNPSRRPLLHIMQGKVGDGPAATAAATELKNLGIQVGHGFLVFMYQSVPIRTLSFLLISNEFCTGGGGG